ncbi:MAG: DUF4838 domain-containing protein [Clostridia bacterium]|nr:DUF4838 domain-containing protein [Clostridia bacterium]
MKIHHNNSRNCSIWFDESRPSVAYSAELLNEYFEKCCGFTFPYNTPTTYAFVLGECEKSLEVIKSEDTTALKNDGFLILLRENTVYIFGNTDLSVVFGVYEFIERFLGVKFFNKDAVFVPRLDEIDITDIRIERTPVFDQRVFLTGFALNAPLCATQFRFNFPNPRLYEQYRTDKLWCDQVPDPHNSWHYLNERDYGESHPEFFYKSRMGNVELCYSNGITDDYRFDAEKDVSVAKLVADKLYGLVTQNPKSKYFVFGKQDDSTANCDCPTCTRRRKLLGGEGGVMVVFLNAVIQEVERRLKEKHQKSDFCVSTLAYHSTVEPPVKDGKPICDAVIPCDKLHIRYAPIAADYTYSFLDERQDGTVKRQLFGWASLTRNLMIWDYQCNFYEYYWYFPNLRYLKENICLYKDVGVSYILNQGAYNIETDWQGEIKAYVCAKLYWDTSLNVKELVEEYVRYYYGVGASKVLQFIGNMEAFFAQKIENGFHLSIFNGDKEYFLPKEYPIEFLQENLNIIESAIRDVEESSLLDSEKILFKRRLQYVLLTPLRMIMKNEKFYFPEAEEHYRARFLALAKELRVVKLGEGLPLYIPMQQDGVCAYKIVLGESYTKEEQLAAEYLQSAYERLAGVKLPIVGDNEVYPYFGEQAICIGEHMMFNEFYKGTIHEKDYAYYIESKGKCLFVAGTDRLQNAIDLLLGELMITGSQNTKTVQLPIIKKYKYKAI